MALCDIHTGHRRTRDEHDTLTFISRDLCIGQGLTDGHHTHQGSTADLFRETDAQMQFHLVIRHLHLSYWQFVMI